MFLLIWITFDGIRAKADAPSQYRCEKTLHNTNLCVSKHAHTHIHVYKHILALVSFVQEIIPLNFFLLFVC